MVYSDQLSYFWRNYNRQILVKQPHCFNKNQNIQTVSCVNSATVPPTLFWIQSEFEYLKIANSSNSNAPLLRVMFKLVLLFTSRMKIVQVWTSEEMEQFKDLIDKYQNDFRQIAQEMNRTYNQIRSQYYNLQRKPARRVQKPEAKQAPSPQPNSNDTSNSSDQIYTQQFLDQLLNYFIKE
ncbi:SANT/Myb_domain [Hexamita inflata]|uniref:SANT/Myb domain n=2 Tax=Hexamita inflata TaxID=28002 RepID=A0AA86U993_9EUKA|nr:SANT/Myb domain [Hexamita inflata]